MSPVGLTELLATLPAMPDDDLLVGVDTMDDAAVYRLSDDRAIVVTADIITPPVDDPFVFGQIAAANALSDVYAMGGRPLLALNLIGFPDSKLPPEVLHGIVAGAVDRLQAAGAVLAGGHTTRDDEPKFGLVVTGEVHPERVWTNAGAEPGDTLILTKPLGSGVLFNAARAGRLGVEELRPMIDSLVELNRAAAETLADFSVHAATDVTGFGLLGHAGELARASSVTCTIDFKSIPIYPQVLAMYRQGVSTGANPANRSITEPIARIDADLDPAEQQMLFDPQTSGGLLVALPADQAAEALAALAAAGIESAVAVGVVEEFAPPHHLVVV